MCVELCAVPYRQPMPASIVVSIPSATCIGFFLLSHDLHHASPARLRDAAVAEQLRPDFEILRTLGVGVTSVVYLAREAALRRLVAIKVLRKDLFSDAPTMKRFIRESQTAARVRHVNVITIYRVGELADGVPYIVMEYVDGSTVREIVGTAGRLPVDEARAVLASTASALIAVHDAGVVHRAVHAGNIYIENKTARAVLRNFSIATPLDLGSTGVARLTQVGVRLGDLSYISPEQLRDERPTRCSDVYAFGVLAYEVLAGRGPYDGKTDPELLVAHVSGTPVKLSSLRADIDVELARLLERCLAKEPTRRPRLADLIATLEGRNAPTRKPAENRGPLGDFLTELSRRHVYKVLVTYGAVAAAIFGTAQVIFDAFEFSKEAYQVVVISTLAGFPVAMVLSWLYDVTSSGILRTAPSPASRRAKVTKWVGLAVSIAWAVLLGWILLRSQ